MKTILLQQYIRRLILRFAVLDSLLDEIPPSKVQSVLYSVRDLVSQLENRLPYGSSYHIDNTGCLRRSCAVSREQLHANSSGDDLRKLIRLYLTISLDALESDEQECITVVDRICSELEHATAAIHELA